MASLESFADLRFAAAVRARLAAEERLKAAESAPAESIYAWMLAVGQAGVDLEAAIVREQRAYEATHTTTRRAA